MTFKKGHSTSEITRRKIAAALSRSVSFKCDYCGNLSKTKPSSFARKKRHFCSQGCYSRFRAERLPKEEQHRFGTGNTLEERKLRRKVRSDTNHAIRDGLLVREKCQVCGSDKSEAHHDNYHQPLSVMWLCFKHHRERHKQIYENADLLKS